MKLEKWQALGNDYLIVEEADLPWDLTPPRIRYLCNPHFGPGADGICVVGDAEGDAVARVSIFNPDGSRAEISGNGVREVAVYLHGNGRTGGDSFVLETDAGPVTPEIVSGGQARVAMGKASTVSDSFPDGDQSGRGTVEADGREWEFQHVSIGNPQCAIEVESGLDGLDLDGIGPEIESATCFPSRTNVSFWKHEAGDDDSSRIRARIFERGVGETLSSGTGATGAAVAAFLGGLSSPVEVMLDGGSLLVEIGDDLDIALTGWARRVCAVELSDDVLAALTAEDEPPHLSGTS